MLGRLGELAALFLKLGTIGFGGPAVHIGMMEAEVVRRRQWLSREYFLDLVGATNLIPGPNSTEMAIHLGFIRAGWAGLVVAGLCFILPAFLITAGLAWAYVEFGSLPQVAPFFYGIKPAVLAVILAAALRLGRTAVKSWRLGVVGVGVVVASLGGVNEVLALFVGGALGMLWLRLPKLKAQQRVWVLAALAGSAALGAAPAAGAAGTAVTVSLWKLGAFFLKVGAVLYGSGYVLVAFLEGGLVHDYAWLTRRQLLDAVAIGQFTPGPVLSTATFVGYLVAGAPGAWVATAAIFLPSFCFVAALNPLVPRLRRSPWTAAFLDAVNVSSIALMAAVTLKLAQSTLTAWPAWLIAASAAALGVGWKVDPSRLILGGAVAGWALSRWGS
jgi:chromate transporter